jgi:hypothetical protein
VLSNVGVKSGDFLWHVPPWNTPWGCRSRPLAPIVFGTIAAARKTLELDPYLVDVLLPDLVGHDKRPATFVLYLWLFAMTRAVGRESAFFSYQVMTDRTGLSKSAVQRAVPWLERRQLLRVRKHSPTAVPEYTVLAPWLR